MRSFVRWLVYQADRGDIVGELGLMLSVDLAVEAFEQRGDGATVTDAELDAVTIPALRARMRAGDAPRCIYRHLAQAVTEFRAVSPAADVVPLRRA